jgi:hypothetical protein
LVWRGGDGGARLPLVSAVLGLGCNLGVLAE